MGGAFLGALVLALIAAMAHLGQDALPCAS
jgi:hypothetical protein